MENALTDVAVRYANPSEITRHWMFTGANGELFVPTMLPGALDLGLGAAVRLSVRFESDPARVFRLHGRIAWKRQKPAGICPSGLGVAFVPGDLTGRDLLWSYVCGKDIPFTDRSSVRVPAALKVSCRAGEEVLDRTTEDISQGGAFIKSERMPPLGTLVDVKLRPPRSLLPMRLHGRITWHRTRAGDRGFGVRFIYRDAQQVGTVKKLVERFHSP